MSVSTEKTEKAKYGKRYHIANREKRCAQTKQWKLDNPGRQEYKYRQYHNSVHGRAKALLKAAQKRSNERNYDFSLDLDWIKIKLENGKCDLTGISFVFDTQRYKHRNPYSPSLDRRDNSKGYTKENCRIILWALNMGFADWGQETYLQIARSLIGYDL